MTNSYMATAPAPDYFLRGLNISTLSKIKSLVEGDLSDLRADAVLADPNCRLDESLLEDIDGLSEFLDAIQEQFDSRCCPNRFEV